MKSKTFFLALILGSAAACHKSNGSSNPNVFFQELDLVADAQGGNIPGIDAKLVNPWGIAVNPAAGIIWVADNHGGATSVFDSTGKTFLGPITVPPVGGTGTGSPTGVVFNGSSDFVIPNKSAAKFIFVSEDGTISAWVPGDNTTTVVANQSASGAVYKGCAIANQAGNNYLFAANFHAGVVDVFDKSFQLVPARSLKDPSLPAGFAPFNVANINGFLYVTYAKQEGPDNEDDEPGMGNGYVDVFSPDGTLLKNFAAKGALNSPWGIAQVPDGFGNPLPRHSILVGNFGDGRINVFDSTGVYQGALQSKGKPIVIPGLWALDFPANEFSKFDPTKLYFTAGPMDEQHGVFGYLKNFPNQ